MFTINKNIIVGLPTYKLDLCFLQNKLVNKGPVMGADYVVSRKNLLFKFLGMYSYLDTKHKAPFIYNYLGLLIVSKFLFKFGNKIEATYKLKKKMYSFLKTNEHKLHIFNTKKRLVLKQITTRIKAQGFFKKKLFFSNRLFFNYFRHTLRNFPKDLTHNTYNNNSFLIEKIFRKTNLVDYGSGSNINSRKEAHIPRVRFKPGYQRLWRHFRLALAEFIDYRYVYQKQLTRFLVKFYRRITKTYISFNESQLHKVVIYSKLVPDHFAFDLFFNNQFIYLNNEPLANKALYVYKNDFIQLEISNWYYIFSRWLRN